MSVWYVSSAAYAGVSAWVGASHAYSVGDLVKPTAPTAGLRWVLRCTTAGSGGTAEPTWPTANNGTVTCSGGAGPFAVFTNVTAQSAFGWTAAAGDTGSINGFAGAATRLVSGDTVYCSSDDSETYTTALTLGGIAGTPYGGVQYLSVNRGGSVPPVAADLLAGATITNSASSIAFNNASYWNGFTFNSATNITLGVNATYGARLDNCALVLNNATAGSRINTSTAAVTKLNNTTMTFGATGQGITQSTTSGELIWTNTANALGGATFPTTLFIGGGAVFATLRGVDISALTGTLTASLLNACQNRLLLDSCKIASGLTRLATASPISYGCVVELVNCFDGTNILNERYMTAGTLTTERTIVLAGGATDDVGAFSHKLVSTTLLDKFIMPFAGFWLDIEQAAIGSPLTATVEIVGSASLNSDDISLTLQYEGTASSSVASFADSIGNPLTAVSAVTTSTATWTSSPATPVYQKLQVAFTPRTAGRLRGLVQLGKASTTVYINPQIAVA